MYSQEPSNPDQFTEEFNNAYSRFGGVYDRVVKWFPLWRNWIMTTLPYIQGPRVLEVSFGTGYLLTRYAANFKTHGIDFNRTLAEIARKNLLSNQLEANLLQADVVRLPYASQSFDTLVNTMAFTGYPDGVTALLEMRRVLKMGGRLVMVDIDYPDDGMWLGIQMVRMWEAFGDIIRDMKALFNECGFNYTDKEIGGFGSVHLYVAQKQ